MKKSIQIFIFIILLTSFKADNDIFIGKVLYKYTFTDLKGLDITDKLAPYLGREQHYFIDGKNYKAYDEKGNWVQLYNSETNYYYYFNKDKTVQKIDGSIQASQKAIITKLDIKEVIAGYECEAIQIETDNITTVYYYNASVKTDFKIFSKHNFGEWNKYLEASGGALSLKFVMTDRKLGYIWTSVATEISRQSLTSNDFELPAGLIIHN